MEERSIAAEHGTSSNFNPLRKNGNFKKENIWDKKSCYRYKMDTTMNPDSEETYKKILLKNGINTPVKNVCIKIPNFHGDQFASQCKLVTVEFADGTIPKLELFVKAAITIGEYAEQMRDVLMFEKEAQYFSKLLPEMEEFAKAQQGYDGFLEGLLPKCYYASDVLIVFENMTYQGFAMLNKAVLHDFQIAEAVIRTLAKFHASKSILSEAGEVLYGGWMQNGVDGAIKILSSKPTPGSEKVLEYLKKYETRGFLKICKLLPLDNQSCSMSLNHGDLWNGNVMFQLNAETKKPESCLMLDLQTIHLGSPAVDLLIYLFIAVDHEVRKKEWKNLVRIFYDQLGEVVIDKLGQKLKFSFEDLLSDFRTQIDIGFVFGMYSVFGFEALANIDGNAMNSEGSALDNLSSTIITSLDRTMEQKGSTFSENIVQMYNEVVDILSEKNNQ
ncbi:unnamed protein product [Allacma fusca]|uniref:CHK kinase-like domain-containing protein n=1 Tax=Allacma fusca TaxID=39272 RepID=A0A8J2LM25_9HEXA|nr:unnamed protein product [Allacma fusca]